MSLLRNRPNRFPDAKLVAKTYAPSTRSVRFMSRLPTSRDVALTLGAGRCLLGAAFLAAPVFSVRVLGVDTASAKRVTFVARMLAARDLALGAGTLGGATRGRPAGWLVAGAAADAADAVLIVAALRTGQARGWPAAAIAAGAVAAAAAGGLAALAASRGS
jgi:hypothetical protein